MKLLGHVAAAVVVAWAPVAFAQEASGSAATDAADDLEVIEVQAHPLSGEGLADTTTVVEGEELRRQAEPSIGATLADEPGIHATSFGQAVGRPVVHGLAGARVRVMEDRIDTMDASVTSQDHPTTVEPFIADRVEVLKGPGTLLYGSGAIGGVVDVHTGRIPHTVPDGIQGRAELRASDNGERQTGAVRVDGGGGGFAWHLDAYTRDAGEYDIPGFAESARLRAMEEHEEHEHDHEGEDHDEDAEEHHEDEEDHDEHEEEEEAYGHVPGSQLEMSGGALGASFIGERGFAGVAISTNRALFGLPGHSHAHHDHEEEHHDHEDEHAEDEDEHEGEHEDEDEHHEEEEGNPTLDLEQTRIDVEVGLRDPFAGFSALNFRMGRNDYEHVELEPNGVVGTRFTNDAYEGRVELVDDDLAAGTVFGLQFSGRDYSVVGEEAFVPPTQSDSLAVFWVGQFAFDGIDMDAGLRLGRVTHDADHLDEAEHDHHEEAEDHHHEEGEHEGEVEPPHGSEDFTPWSASVGIFIPTESEWQWGFRADISSRAPVIEELFSHGPHLATQSFEIGDASLGAERATNLAATLSRTTERFSFHATAYRNGFANFIYQHWTGEEEDELPVAAYAQDDASFVGLDLAVEYKWLEFDNGDVTLKLMYDFVDAELDISGNGNMPRLPPSRIGLGINGNWGDLTASLNYRRMGDSDDVAVNELPTDGWTDVRAYIGYHLQAAQGLEVFLQGRNLTDEEQREHVSSIKDLAPLPGRTLEAGVRIRV
ncbi:MAG: TonB-dependent receptor [Gammaproteobacteria bacterium]|nr:TonB-dependent receptor [Gammaproteobacteria bacterium]